MSAPGPVTSAPACQSTSAAQVMRSQHTRQLVQTVLAIVVLLLSAAILALALANAYWIRTLTSAMALSIAAVGVALLYGQLGLVSLCQYALVGVGGWVALRISHGWGLPFELCVVSAGLTASVVGVIAGLPALRMKGLYLALVTLMMAGGYQVLINSTGFPDGGTGWLGRVVGSERQLMPRPYGAESDTAYFIYVVIWVAIVLCAVEVHRHNKPGRSWALIRRGERVALAGGVNLLLYQSWAFALAGFCAGISGALLACGIGQLDGRSFAAHESVMLFALTVIAGCYHWSGAIIAGVLLRAVPALLNDWDINAHLATVFFGAALLYNLITAPRGIAGQVATLFKLFQKRRRSSDMTL